VPALLSLHSERPATIFTIHNIAYQGLFDYQTFVDLQFPAELWHMDGLEFYGQLSFIKGGLAYADKLTTVSPTYAQELLEPEFSYGLDGLLRHRKQDLVGIINGIDTKHWNPGTDPHLTKKYNWRNLDNKSVNKTALQQELGLAVDDSVVMLGMVSRLVEQKGLDLILQSLDHLFSSSLQLVILGTGETRYEMLLSDWAKRQPDNMRFIIGYDEALAHRIEAASDIYLMPSIFEPCGLNQLYSLRYGTLPIITPVGGLFDTVTDASSANINQGVATGFVLKEKTSTALLKTIGHALKLYQNKPVWRQLQRTAMQLDYSWQASAEHYIELYQQVLQPN
jgi:starch synthase